MNYRRNLLADQKSLLQYQWVFAIGAKGSISDEVVIEVFLLIQTK